MNSKNKTSRVGGVDLLRSIAIILVIICHALPDSNGSINGYRECVVDLNIPGKDVSHIIMILMKNCGMIGNDIFMACSAWFLLDNNQVKKKKIVEMISDTVFISISISIILIIIGYPGISKVLFIKSFFPILMNANWFVTCYLILYMIHPILNKFINNLEQKRLLQIVLLLLFFYSIVQVLYKGGYYYNDLVGAIVIYFVVAYIKYYLNGFRHNINLNFYGMISIILFHVLFTVIINLLGKMELISFSMLKFNTNINPCFILIAIFSMNIALNLKIKNKYLEIFSKLSMLIYEKIS